MLRPVMFGAAAIALSLTCQPALAQSEEPATATDVWEIGQGGQLYDEWWAVTLADEPEATHPAYPAEGKKTGSTTWRCKECHGWDYEGAAGAYSKGSHFTGIKGIQGLVGARPEEIEKILRNDQHGLTSEMLSDSALHKLALFVSLGQIDTDAYIDRVSKNAKGDPAAGARYYQTICAVCHGFDGKAINFHSDDDPEYIGTIGADNPWEALHKIRFGQPGVGMVALGALGLQTAVDILAYIQTLPVK